MSEELSKRASIKDILKKYEAMIKKTGVTFRSHQFQRYPHFLYISLLF